MADTSDYHDSGLRPASSLSSWVSVAAGADFPIQNLPWGVGVLDGARHVLTRIGDSAISMAMLAQTAAFASEPELRAAFAQPTLNAFMGLGKPLWRRARAILQELLGSNATAEQKAMVQGCMRPVAEVTMCLPADIGDYTVG